MRQQINKREAEKLNDIYLLIRVDMERAWHGAIAARLKYKSTKLTYSYAKAQMIVFIIAVILRNKTADEINFASLIDYFEQNGHKEDASMLMLHAITYKRVSGANEESITINAEYERKYGEGATFEQQINRMIATGNFKMMRTLDKTEQMNLALNIESLLRSRADDSAWYRTSLSSALLLKAEALSHTADIDKVRAAIDESIALIDVPGTSLQYVYTAYYFKGNVAAIAGRTDEALKTYYVLEKKFTGQKFFNHLLILVYIQIFKQLNEKFSKPDTSILQKEELLKEQMKYMALSNSLLSEQNRPYLVAYLSLSEARLMRVTGEYKKAISCLGKALRVFFRNNITNHIIDIYEEAHITYEAWAKKEHSHILYRKAIMALKKAHELTYRYNQSEGKEKMDALVNKYELEQKELSEKLLKQKVDALNKEIQLAALNLQDKLMVLEELKTYISSLQKKGQESNKLIHAIAQKIASVIITEQDKSTLQQKIDEGNDHFYQVLSEKYPALSTLEIHMCGLFKTGMTNKELAKLYGQGEKSYEQHRYRIKKKLGLGAEEKLVKFLMGVVAA